MKTVSKIAMFICIALSTLQAQPKHVYVPDANFRNALVNHTPSYNITQGVGDTVVVPDIATVDTLDVILKSIKNLQGIEEFTALQYLDCSDNEITKLDMSNSLVLGHLSCKNNKLTTLNISKNTELFDLWCHQNQLTTLDVSQNEKLNIFNCQNNQFRILDVSKNIELLHFFCNNNPLLTTVYVWVVPFLDYADNHNRHIYYDAHTQFVLAPSTPVKEKQSLVVHSTQLESNYPNPFNPATTIHYEIANAGVVNLKVYDVLGKEIATLVNEKQNVGKYTINFDASHLPAGMYFYRLQSGEFVETKKMVLLK